MKTTKPTKQPAPKKAANETPKYYLADVPEALRSRVLDLCFRRLYHEALELLGARGFNDYTQDDLINFYHWAPAKLPGQIPNQPDPPRNIPRDYEQPSPEQIEDIRKRLADVPPDLMERVHHALQHASIDAAASLLWKAGAPFTSAELYEYRKTLFPPNAMVDPYTSGPPLLRPGARVCDPQHSRPEDGVRAPEPPPSPDGGTTANGFSAVPSETAASRTTHHAPRTTDGPSLLTDLRNLITRHVVLPDMAAETLALWVVHTYAFTLRQVTTYIGVVSPEKRCGKTTLLELLARLANRSLTAANISPSALFKVIQETSPTLLIDEADTFLQGRDELAGILNAGYRKGNAYVLRVADGKPRRKSEPAGKPAIGEWTNERLDGSPGAVEFAQYSCWCPKVMAAIGRLPDTLADRCIVITMQRKMPGEKCERLRQLNAADYRQRCADFVRAHSEKIAHAQPELPSTLNDRAADIWEPLFAIADLAGGDWPALARQAAQKLSGHDDEITLIGYFLTDLRNWMLHRKVDRVLSRDIVAAFNPSHTRPWEDLRRGREINEYWLAAKMRELGIRPKYLRVGDTTARGYMLADIEAAFRRYVPNHPDVHAQPSKPEHPASPHDAAVTNAE